MPNCITFKLGLNTHTYAHVAQETETETETQTCLRFAAAYRQTHTSTATHTHTHTHLHTLSCHTHTRAYAVCVYPWHAKSAQLMNSSVLIITHTPHCAKDVEHTVSPAPTPFPVTANPLASHSQLKLPSTGILLPPPSTALYTTHFVAQIVPGFLLCTSASHAACATLSSFLLVMLPVLPFRGCQKTFIQFCTEIHTHTGAHTHTRVHIHSHTRSA